MLADGNPSRFHQVRLCSSGLERGQRNPTIITLYELAQALGVSHVELVQPDDGTSKS
ncbi:helix-turn-helix transcriptional regulator [Mesorhizobium sp. B2-3-5]|uniref:helix-turn-helix domain-containing protein n=1 Tax=Mesorhizobium sp. B2-3-5 TaxID=2589958 RepID=UPI001FF05934|nr:helix-turn-helix transcriptional regulator [Mesorhizobium sp. B2-3-5]